MSPSAASLTSPQSFIKLPKMLLRLPSRFEARGSLFALQSVIFRGREHGKGHPDSPCNERGSTGIVVKLEPLLLSGLGVTAYRLPRELVCLGVAFDITLSTSVMPITACSVGFHPADHRALHRLIASPRQFVEDDACVHFARRQCEVQRGVGRSYDVLTV